MLKKLFDNIDTRILKALQRNGRLQNNELANEIGLSNSACLRRVNHLEENGVIDSYVALLNPKKVNCHLIVYVQGTFFEEDSELKERFINLWSNFEEIYTRFNECLAQQGLAYEGALYREVVEKTEIDFQNDNYIFVGFNMMQIVEQKLCERLQKLGKAHFYWDFDDYYMKNQDGIKHEAGTYIRQYLKYFPNELDVTNKQIYANFEQPKNITYLSATTENIQARYISTWLKQNGRIDDGRRTAIVLADENLLPTVIHCLPPELKHVNITTGYPLQHAPIASFVRLLINLHTMGYSANRHSFSKKWRTMLMRHPYMKYIENQETVLDFRVYYVK